MPSYPFILLKIFINIAFWIEFSFNSVNKNDNGKTKIIYKQKIKVALSSGGLAFYDAARN